MLRSFSVAVVLCLFTAEPTTFGGELTFVYTDTWEKDWEQSVLPGEATENGGIYNIIMGDQYQGPSGTAVVPKFDSAIGTLNHVTREVTGQAKLLASVVFPIAPSGVYNINNPPYLEAIILADPDESLPFDTSWPISGFLGIANGWRELPVVGASPGGDVTTVPATAFGDTTLAVFDESDSFSSSLGEYIGSGNYEMNYDSSLIFDTGVHGGADVPSPEMVENINGFYNGQLLVAYTFTPDPTVLHVDNDGRPLLAGDVNLDGYVGIDDLNIILGNWNLSGRIIGYNEGDIAPFPLTGPIGDDVVGIGDLNLVLGNWGAGTPPAAVVPEPVSVVLVGAGGLALIRRR